MFFVFFSAVSVNAQTKKPLLEQKDTLDKYTLYKDRLVLYSDLGFISSPFFMSFKDTNNLTRSLSYRINHGITLGIGGSYKWFSLRLSYMVAPNIENTDRYGKTSYFKIHAGFPFKQTYTEIDLLQFRGYALIFADKKIPNFTEKTIVYPKIRTSSVAISTYYFFNSDFSLNSAFGKSGNFNTKVASWYGKASIDYKEVYQKGQMIIPDYFTENVYDKDRANRIGAFEIGLVPGFAYVNRIKNWQFSGVAGVGVSIQQKYYTIGEYTRHFLGISPRIDTKINIGYNPEDWFIMLGGELDYTQINFHKLVYGNPLFSVRITGGYRFKVKN